MFDLSPQHLIQLLPTYGYLAVLIVVGVESMGVPVPGEAMLIVAAAYAGTTHRLHGLLVIAFAAAGAIIGDNVGYLAGRTGGHRLLARYGRYRRLDAHRLRTGQYLFDRHGGKVVFLGRFVGILRIWAAFLAGVHGLPWKRFLLFNAARGILWAALVGSIAYTFGAGVLRYGGPAGLISMLLATVVMIAVSVGLRRKEQQLQAQLEAEASVLSEAA